MISPRRTSAGYLRSGFQFEMNQTRTVATAPPSAVMPSWSNCREPVATHWEPIVTSVVRAAAIALFGYGSAVAVADSGFWYVVLKGNWGSWVGMVRAVVCSLVSEEV